MLNYCIVKQRIGAITEDTPDDDDRYPDYTSVFGQVVFAPTMANGSAYKITDDDGVVHTVPATRITAQIVNGEITHEGLPGLPLFAAGPNANPSTIVYTATYTNLTAAGQPITLNNITFRAVPGETIDLSSYTPVAGAPTPGIIQGPPGHTPFIGQNGNWWISGKDTGVVASSPIVHRYAELTTAFEENTLRVKSLEAMNGVSPESPVDGQTANLISQPDSLTRTAMDAIVDKTPYTITTYEHMADAFKKVLYQEDRNTLYATTQNSTGAIWKTTTGGASWSQVGTLGYEPHALNKVQGTGTLIAVEKTRTDQPNMNVRVSRSTDDGATWTQVTTINFPGLGPDTISSPTSGVVLLAEYGNIGQTVYRILRSANDGVTWTTVFSSSGTAHVLDPGHIHSVVRDPETNALIAFVDYSQPELWGSNDHGATWDLIGTSTKTHHPNWVRPMFFQDHIAWGNDNEAVGRVYRIPRDDFYAGNFDASEEVAKLGNQRFYSHMEILPGVWLMAGATEFVNRERPTSYSPRLYIVSDEATQIVGGAEMVLPNPNLQGSSTGNRFDLPGGPLSPMDREGHTWVNLPTQGYPNPWSMVPITVGLDVPTSRLTSGFTHSPIIPNNTPIRARTGDGSSSTGILLMDSRGVTRLSATGQRLELDPSAEQIGFYFGSHLTASLKQGQFRLHGSPISLANSGPSMYTGDYTPENARAGFPGSIFVKSGADASVWQRTSGVSSGSAVDGWRRLMPAPEVSAEETLLNATSRVNTRGKFHGRFVVEFRTNRLLIAHGDSPTAPWGDTNGEIVYTPE